MANIVPVPIILNDVVLQLGTDNYEASVSTVRLDPTSNVVRWKGMTPTSSFSAQTAPEWAYTISGAQDLATATSLQNYFLANAGKKVAMKFKPKKPATGTAPTVTITINVAPPAIGGDIDQIAAFTVTGGCDGQPSIAAE